MTPPMAGQGVSVAKHTVTIEVDTDRLPHYEDHYIAHLWHVSQANPLPWGTREAGELARVVGYEIIRRWLERAPVELYAHQPCDEFHKARIDALPADDVARSHQSKEKS